MKLSLFLCLSLSCGATLSGRATDLPPNIVLLLVDDLGVMDTSLPFLTDDSGSPRRYPLNDFYRTPHLERLAARGIRFSQFYAMSVCSPSRISLLTGQNAARHRTTNWINPDQDNRGAHGPPGWNWRGLRPGAVTLPDLLRGAGYRTIHVGKAHLGPGEAPGAEPRNLGFDVNIGGRSIGQPGSYHGRENYARSARHAVPHLEKYHGTDTFLTDALTREANAQIRAAVAAGQPFFLHLSHYAVHAPFDADPRFAAQYADSDQPAPARAYASLVAGVDASLGQVLAQLDELGVAARTLIIFMGDNGGDAPLGSPHAVASAAPLRGKKGAHYEGGMRVPFVAAWAAPQAAHPAQQRLPIAMGAVQSQLAAIHDLFPTLLQLAGVTPPDGHVVDGVKLDTLLAGRPDPTRPEVFLMHYPHGPHRSEYWTSYREGPWKVIYHYRPADEAGPRYELFNLAQDPFESTDLATTAPGQLTRLMRGLISALESHGALFPVAADGVTPLPPRLP